MTRRLIANCCLAGSAFALGLILGWIGEEAFTIKNYHAIETCGSC